MQVRLLKDDPYGEIICRYFNTAFPGAIIPSASQLLEILTLIFIGDKNTRLGPVPPPEQLVVIRKVISKCIETGLPIPILIAWGGRKTDASKSVDVAEVVATHQIVKLSEAVNKFYTPGIKVNIRVEDTGADWIYREDANIFENVERYSDAMVKLVRMLTAGHSIKVVRESWLMVRDEYFSLSAELSLLMQPLIMGRLIDENADLTKHESMIELEKRGWKGGIPMNQINHYLDRYKSLYPGLAMIDYVKMLADYLGGSKARYDLNGRANPSDDGFISISFVPPIPGSPVSMFNNVLYYRTVSMKDARTHIAPWRAKGYLEIAVDNSIKVKLSNWGNKDLINELHEVKTEFIDDGDKVCIDTDYIVHEFEMPFMI